MLDRINFLTLQICYKNVNILFDQSYLLIYYYQFQQIFLSDIIFNDSING